MEDWKPILSDRKFEEILNNAINGYNKLPAKGMCDDCSNKDIKMALVHMLERVDFGKP